MTLTLPTLAPTPYALTNKDFNLCKADRSGALRGQKFTLSVPSGTASGTLIGLVPFQKGFTISLSASNLCMVQLDNSSTVTLSWGYTYYDSTLGTSQQANFASAVTTAQAGGEVSKATTEAARIWTAAAPGWITVLTAAAATNVTGDIYGEIVGSYDVSLGV